MRERASGRSLCGVVRPHLPTRETPIRPALFLLLVAAACVPDPRPKIEACAVGDTAAAAGALRIAPSKVPGVLIDSAGWRTDAHTFDIGAETQIVLAARLRTTRPIALDSIALLYRLDRPGQPGWSYIMDVQLGEPIYTARVIGPNLDPRFHFVIPQDSVIRVEYLHTVEDGWSTSRHLRTSCPSEVTVLPRRDLLRALSPELFSPGRIAALVADHPARASGKPGFLFLYDTLVPAGLIHKLVLGLGLNTTDTALSDVAVGLVVDTGPSWTSAEGHRPPSWARADTLIYRLGSIGPRDTVAFAGTFLLDQRPLGRIDMIRVPTTPGPPPAYRP